MAVVVPLLTFLLGTCLVVSWLYTLANTVMAALHRAEGVSLTSLGFNGLMFLNPDNFTEEGQRYQGRMFMGLGGFMVSVMTLVPVTLLGTSG